MTAQPGANVVECGGEPVLFWSTPPHDPDFMEKLVTDKARADGMKELAPAPCAIQGTNAMCRVFKAAGASDRTTLYFARVRVRDQPLALFCVADGGSRALPPACALVLSLESQEPITPSCC